MKRVTPTLKKTTKLMTAAVLTAGLLLPTTALLGTNGAHAAAVTTSTQAAKSVKMTWNGKAVSGNAFQAAGNTYVPVKALAKAAGLSLAYDKTTGLYNLGTSPNTLTLSPYEGQVWIGANGVGLQAEGRVSGGTMYVPLSVLRDYAGIDGVWNASAKTVALKTAASTGITITQKTLKKSEDDGAIIDIRYPELSGSAAGIGKINAALKKHAQAFLSDFEKQVEDFGPLDSEVMHYEADGNYMIAYNKNGLLSVVTQDYGFYGGAHGGTVQSGYNFDVKTGKEVSLAQLLKANPKHRSAIDKKIAAEFKKQGSLLEEGGFKTIGNAPGFYVTNGGFTIFFQQYEYTPYAAGIPSFDFTFASLLPKGTDPFAGL